MASETTVHLHGYAGYVWGCRHPSWRIHMPDACLSVLAQAEIAATLAAACPGLELPSPVPHPAPGHASMVWLLQAWHALQIAVGVPVQEPGRVLQISPSGVVGLLPTLAHAQTAVRHVIEHTVSCRGSAPKPLAQLQRAVRDLAQVGTQASNVPRFVAAAHALGMPCRSLVAGVYQYGEGSRARWIDSTFTDRTPQVSARLARNKIMAASVLRQAGLPVPDHARVRDADEAVRVAQRLGYPVVVKPADRDGGAGVSAGLLTEAEVRIAHEQARRHSANVLVERHVPGRDYRLYVFQGALFWAVDRQPAAVTGDGRLSVQALIEQANLDPRRGTGPHAPLKRLMLDDEALTLLTRQSLTPTDIPASGQQVRLRRAANVASGGVPVPVLDRVHPDNARLAIRAAELLRLDIAGVDLLIPDIAVSWLESGAAICEVNGQPTLGQVTSAHLYAPLLTAMVPGNGRIPTVLVVGAEQPGRWLDALSSAFHARGLRVGRAIGGLAEVDGERLNREPTRVFSTGCMLVMDRRVDVLLLAIEDDTLLHSGLPVERVDALILAGRHVRVTDPDRASQPLEVLSQLLSTLLPACDGQLLQHAEGGIQLKGEAGQAGAAIMTVAGPVDRVAEAVCHDVLKKRALVVTTDPWPQHLTDSPTEALT